MEKEIWKDNEGYEGLYKVSNKGNIKSLERTVWDSRGYYRTVHERILKPGKDRYGYLYVILCKEGIMKTYYVHRLVATAFCENPEGYTEVNHKDENKQNNCMENLEWCSRSYNLSYNGRAKKAGKKAAEKLTNHPKTSKPIIGIDKVTGLIVEFASALEAERETGIAQQNICACCKGKRNSCGGFYWMYANTDDAE